MPYTLERFCSDARSAFAEDAGPSGREKLARPLEKLLADPAFIAGRFRVIGVRSPA